MGLNNCRPIIQRLTKLVFLAIVFSGICLPAVAFTGNLQDELNNVTGHLANLRLNISENQALDVDTSEAETCYNNASQQLASAKDNLTHQNYSSAMNDLAAAEVSINAGKRAADRAWAVDETVKVRRALDNAGYIISFIESDPNLVNASRYSEVIAKREEAEGYLAAADDEIAKGNYSLGHELAQKAWLAENGSYTEAMAIVPDQQIGPEDQWIMLKIALSDIRIIAFTSIAGGVLVIALAVTLIKRSKNRDKK